MEFLDKLVLPQSAEHIELLHYLLTLILFLFMPFIAAIFGGTLLSLYYRRRGLDEGNNLYLRFSKDIIELVTINKGTGVILGIVPVLTSLLIYAQLLHTTNSTVVSYIGVSFFLISIALILIYTYRYTLSFSRIFDIVKDSPAEEEDSAEIKQFREANRQLSTKSGRYGIVLLFLALWLFTAAMALSTDTLIWNDDPLFAIFYWKVLVNFLNFIAVSFAITGSAIFFGYFYWDGGRKNLSPEYKTFLKSLALKITFVSALVIPIFILISVFTLPVDSLSGSVFTYSVLALFLLFIAYHFLYAMIRDAHEKYSGQVFFAILFAILALIVKDQAAMNNATQVQSAVLSAQFTEYITSLRGETSVAVISGKEIFDVRCSSCHRFDQKLVGPPYDTTLPKYEGNINGLTAYIMNPTKIDPAYPPMPNPGLRPAEAKAVAEYIMEEYKK